MTRIVLVDDHPLFRKGLIALLRANNHEVVGEAASGLEAIQVVAREHPNLVIMDLSMPEMGGIEATEMLTAVDPNLRVVVVTLHDDEATVARALRAGASAYATKQATPEQILAAIDAATAGALWVGPGVPRALARQEHQTSSISPSPSMLPGLTPREGTIAGLVGRGLTNPMIAARLNLSVKTVANYVSTIALKLGADNRADLAMRIRVARDH
ncbi:response regulator transcription factor [Leucobacter salsicius]|uniref:response regulator transcription factor n=1 Tax=Leucobacter salsicius TaxID=664638 RepID=UPI0003460AD3|nr:response regulator transcription factor [Leucobacter salsicius]